MIALAMAKHLTLAEEAHIEVDPIKRSRFIACGAPMSSAEEAKSFVSRVRAEYPDAGHHCFAWRLDAGDAGFRVSDDGEPGGTAGLPILNHIDGAGLRNVVIVVVRYFGGTKLGKGGLIRAYGGTAGALIRQAEVIEVEETLLHEHREIVVEHHVITTDMLRLHAVHTRLQHESPSNPIIW